MPDHAQKAEPAFLPYGFTVVPPSRRERDTQALLTSGEGLGRVVSNVPHLHLRRNMHKHVETCTNPTKAAKVNRVRKRGRPFGRVPASGAVGFSAWSLLPGYRPDLLHEAHCVGDTPVLGDPSIL